MVIDKIKAVHPEVPVIIYINKSGALLERMATSGVDIVSLDWTVTVPEARKRIGTARLAPEERIGDGFLQDFPSLFRVLVRIMFFAIAKEGFPFCSLDTNEPARDGGGYGSGGGAFNGFFLARQGWLGSLCPALRTYARYHNPRD